MSTAPPPASSCGVVLYRFRASYKKQDGECSIGNVGVLWSNGSTSVEMPYAAMALHEVSPRTHPKCMLQLKWVSESQKPLVFTVLDANFERAYKNLCDAKVTISTVLKSLKKPKPTEEPPAKRAKKDPVEEGVPMTKKQDGASKRIASKRRDLLTADGRLSAAYAETVGAGVVSEDDFWAAHASNTPSMFATSAAEVKPLLKGPSNALLADIIPDTESAGETRNYILTSEKVANIFAMYPAVKRAHQELVPKKMKGGQFWVKYFQSRYFLRDKGEAVAAGLVEETDDVFARYDDPARSERDRQAEMRDRLSQNKSSQWDLTRTAAERTLIEDKLSHEPLGCASAEEVDQLDAQNDPLAARAEHVVSKMNRHADIVLRASSGTAPSRREDDDAFEELNAPHGSDFLAIDVSERAERQSALLLAQRREGAAPSEVQQLPEWTIETLSGAASLDRAKKNARLAMGLLDRKAKATTSNTQPPPEPFRSETERSFGAASELLSHLYRFSKQKESKTKEDKMRKIIERLEEIMRTLVNKQESVKLKPLIDQLSWGCSILSRMEEKKHDSTEAHPPTDMPSTFQELRAFRQRSLNLPYTR